MKQKKLTQKTNITTLFKNAIDYNALKEALKDPRVVAILKKVK